LFLFWHIELWGDIQFNRRGMMTKTAVDSIGATLELTYCYILKELYANKQKSRHQKIKL